MECSSRSVEFCFRRHWKPSGCRDRPSGFVLHGVVGECSSIELKFELDHIDTLMSLCFMYTVAGKRFKVQYKGG